MQTTHNAEPAKTLKQMADLKNTVQETNLLIPGKLYVYSKAKRSTGWMNQDRSAISVFKNNIDPQGLVAAYQAAAKATVSQQGGCSATTLLMTHNGIDVAWLGDSPAFLTGIDPNSGRIQEIMGLNEPHIPFYEREAILARGGRVNAEGRLDLAAEAGDQVNNYSLSMSRAFGNAWLGDLLNREPGLVHIPTNTLNPALHWYAVIGSDGILPESERNLMHPRKADAHFDDRDLITYCAQLFQQLVNAEGKSWLPDSGHWADDIAHIAQERLRQMEAVADKQEVGYAAVDDTTVMIISLAQDFLQTPAIVLSVTDGHREGGEITAQKAVEAIHQNLSSAGVL